MTGLGVNMNSQTQSVNFPATALVKWFNNLGAAADEYRIFMGCYPPGTPNAGRTTVIVWPYKNGQPATDATGALIQPYNDGAGFP